MEGNLNDISNKKTGGIEMRSPYFYQIVLWKPLNPCCLDTTSTDIISSYPIQSMYGVFNLYLQYMYH